MSLNTKRIVGWFARRPRLRRWLLILGITIFLYTILGFFLVPAIVKWVLEDNLSSALKRTTTVEGVSFNPYTLVLEVEGLQILEPDGSERFAGFGRLHANLEILSVLKWALLVDELRFEAPYLRVVLNRDGELNFSDLLDGQPAAAPREPGGEQEEGSGLPIILNDLAISEGHFEYADLPNGETHTVSEFALHIPFASMRDDERGEFIDAFIRAKLNDRPLELKGQTKPFSDTLETQFGFSLDNLELDSVWPYVPVPRKPDLAGGTFSCDLALSFRQAADGRPELGLSGTLRLDNLALRTRDGQELFGFESFVVALRGFNLGQMHLTCDSVEINAPFARVALDEQGNLNWTRYLPVDQATPEEPATSRAGREFRFDLGTLAIHRGRIAFSDGSGGRDFRKDLAPLEIEVKGFSTSGKDAEYKLSVGPEGGERLELAGQFHYGPLRFVQGKFAAHRISIPAYQAYFSDHLPFDLKTAGLDMGFAFSLKTLEQEEIKVSDFSLALSEIQIEHPDLRRAVTRIGRVSLSGGTADLLQQRFGLESIEVTKLAFDLPRWEPDRRHRATMRTLSLTGIQTRVEPPELDLERASLGGLSLFQRGTPDRIFGLGRLQIRSVRFRGEPKRLQIRRARLRGVSLDAVIDENGILNLGRALGGVPSPPTASEKAETHAEAQTAPEARPATPPDLFYSVGRFLLENTQVRFVDHSVKPAFLGSVDDIACTADNISNLPGTRANLQLDAKVNQDAGFELNGRISPTDVGLNPQLAMTLRELDLTRMSPYAVKYLSYPVTTGKLNLSFELSVSGRALTGKMQNRIAMFELGDEIESPDDLGIPITLALAILRDSSGGIELEIPISGNLDDPEFALGGIILDAILNVISKIVTAPFRFIASLFGGGEDLDRIPMQPGSAALDEDSRAKLDTIVRAMTDRPGLHLVITGATDAKLDETALTERNLARAVKTRKAVELKVEDQTPDAVDQIRLAPAEYAHYLEQAWLEAGMGSREIPAEIGTDPQKILKWKKGELRLRLAATAEDLQHLRLERVQAVKSYLLRQEGIQPERLFTRETADQEPDEESEALIGVLLGLE